MKTIDAPAREARHSSTSRRRARRAAAVESPTHVEETPQATSRLSKMPGGKSIARRALVPLTEAYFVSVGAIDWLVEKAVIIERNLSDRGHRRNETLGQLASRVSANAGEKTREISKRGRARVAKMGERVQEMATPHAGVAEPA